MAQSPRARIRSIIAATAAKHGMSEADILVRDRHAHVVAARSEAWAVARQAGFTFTAIAKVGGWDHSSVGQGVARHWARARSEITRCENV